MRPNLPLLTLQIYIVFVKPLKKVQFWLIYKPDFEGTKEIIDEAIFLVALFIFYIIIDNESPIDESMLVLYSKEHDFVILVQGNREYKAV
jgi:hypothetical protein